MNDFRIKVFLSVAQNLSFTKASAELHISQPAISNHIKEIESMYNVQLFERIKNTIRLTWQGRLFLRYAEDLDNKYKELEFQMNLAGGDNAGELVIGASATIADYILPSIMAAYMSNFPEVKLSLARGNSQQIERLVSENKVDIGLVEGVVNEGEFRSSVLGNEELVLVKSYDNKNLNPQISVHELTKIPLVLSENGSDTLDLILNVLKSREIEYFDLNVIAHLDTTESIKCFISNGENYAIVPISAVASQLLRNKLSIVEVLDLKFYSEFLFLSPLSNQLAENFVSFVRAQYVKISYKSV